jgi:glutathione S-transferase
MTQDHQATTREQTARAALAAADIGEDAIRAIVVETLCEQQKVHRGNIETIVDRAITTVLTSFGIEEEDRRELRADFQHLRRWRKSVEQAQSYTFKAVITIIVAGFLGAVWLGIKAMLGR